MAKPRNGNQATSCTTAHLHSIPRCHQPGTIDSEIANTLCILTKWNDVKRMTSDIIRPITGFFVRQKFGIGPGRACNSARAALDPSPLLSLLDIRQQRIVASDCHNCWKLGKLDWWRKTWGLTSLTTQNPSLKTTWPRNSFSSCWRRKPGSAPIQLPAKVTESGAKEVPPQSLKDDTHGNKLDLFKAPNNKIPTSSDPPTISHYDIPFWHIWHSMSTSSIPMEYFLDFSSIYSGVRSRRILSSEYVLTFFLASTVFCSHGLIRFPAGVGFRSGHCHSHPELAEVRWRRDSEKRLHCQRLPHIAYR